MSSGAGGARQKSLPPNPLQKSQTDPLPLEEQIRIRAHEIWLKRGGQDGSAKEDWLQAEQEILNEPNETRK